jgi:hypothetical protein
VGVSEKALAKVNPNLGVEQAKATRKEYLEKMAAHTARAKHSLGLDKMLGGEEGRARWEEGAGPGLA